MHESPLGILGSYFIFKGPTSPDRESKGPYFMSADINDNYDLICTT